MTVAALFVDSRGPYPLLLGPELCWDKMRDARTYAGPWPVVSHPPCGPWGKMAWRSKEGEDIKALGPLAVAQVRKFGGVLEHPVGSALLEHCGIPAPGELPDQWGGVTIEEEQVRWGHVARKRTWLYLVGVRRPGARPPPREPTHWVSGFRTTKGRVPANYRRQGSAVPDGIKVCSAQQRRRTPLAFAKWLIWLAEQANERQRHG